ncbi:MAG TPA: AI-2E family transporter, partial [Firmicutes bacterium]|nr:AI-2E family transporter [Bacillota bacterium]
MITIDKNWDFALKLVFILFCFIFVVWFFNKILWIFTLVVISVLIVYSIAPLKTYLEKNKVPPLIAVLVVYTSFILTIVLFLYLVIPTVIQELRGMVRFLRWDYDFGLLPFIEELNDLFIAFNLSESIQTFLQELPLYAQRLLERTVNFTRIVFSNIVNLVIVLFLVFYLLRDIEKVKASIIRMFPDRLRGEATSVLAIIDAKVGAYLRGNLIRCGIVGFLTGLGLFFLGMPFSFVLGLTAGIFNIVYYIGPYLAAIPAVILSFSLNTPNPVIVILLYLAVQALDGFVLSPVLLGKAVDLQPFTVIVSLMIGGAL